MSELYYQIALGLIESVGPITAKKLISYCGGVEAVFSERYAAISKIPGVAQLVARNVTQFNQAERVESELKFIADHKIAVHFYLDDDFPHRLKYCEDGPILIYRRGKDILNHTRMVSIVGTRNATKSGKAFCEELIEQLIPHDVVVVSGLAYGIDITAHRACLKYGVPTIGVLAHGLDRIYPALHRKTAIDMQHSGALVTEFMSQTNPDRENFPSRNRIVGGMTDATIVIESRDKGGSLITADLAFGYNRDVFAVPGRPSDVESQGCLRLLRENKAYLLTSLDDLVKNLGWDVQYKGSSVQKSLFVDLSPEEEALLGCFASGRASLDGLSISAGRPVSEVSAMLLGLEFKGVVRALPGKVFEMA
jgi:DNA processing protein